MKSVFLFYVRRYRDIQYTSNAGGALVCRVEVSHDVYATICFLSEWFAFVMKVK